MLLGTLLKQAVRAQVSFAEDLHRLDPELAARIDAEAQRVGLDSREFVADTLQRFLSHEDGESWTTIVGNIQRSDDPGYAFVATVMRKRLDHECGAGASS
jgi:hypothetical protein